MSQNRENPESPRTIENSFTLSLPYEKVEKKILPQYRKLNEVISGLSYFGPICLDKGMVDLDIPGERCRRFEWMKQIKISYGYSYEISYSAILILKTFYLLHKHKCYCNGIRVQNHLIRKQGLYSIYQYRQYFDVCFPTTSVVFCHLHWLFFYFCYSLLLYL